MKRLENVKVGDKLTVHKQYGMSRTLRTWSFPTVTGINKRWMTDSNGDKWTLDGYTWGVSGWERGDNFCEPYEPEHDAMAEAANDLIRLDRMRSILGNVRWKDIDDDIVRKAYAMVKAARDGAQATT